MGPELRDGGPCTPSKLPQLGTDDNTATSIPTQQATGLTMDWNVLPPEMEDHILCSMPLLELARVSTTCRAFHACFRRRMDEQDAARIDMAARCFGRNRITCIAGLVATFLRREPMDPDLSTVNSNACRISEEGVLQVDRHVLIPFLSMGRPTCEAGEVMVAVSHGLFMWPLSRMNMLRWSITTDLIAICVISPNLSSVFICANRLHNMVTVDLHPYGDDDLEGMAFMQALLTWGSASSWHDVRPSISIHLRGLHLRNGGCTVTPHPLLAQILPLLPLVARHGWTMGRWVEGVIVALPWPCSATPPVVYADMYAHVRRVINTPEGWVLALD